MRTKAFFLASIILMWGSAAGISHAQVTNITSSGLGTTISSISPIGVVTITGGTRPGNGTNLFHSFGLFNVGSGDTANFFNNTGLPTTNILSRVTGGNPSNIFGTIQTDPSFGSANLFLINPAGVVFGPSASLNVGGSFHVSTADYVRLTDNVLFNAKPNAGADALLSSAPVAAFGFLPTTDPRSILAGAPRGDIVVQGSQLSVPNDQAISFVGGDITMTGGTLSAPGGQINLASVASPGEVLLPSVQAAPNVDNATFTAMGTINLSQGATLDVSGDGGGTVRIRGGQLVVDNAFIFANTLADVDGTAIAIDVDVHDKVTLSNGSQMFAFSFGMGRGGDIVVTAPVLTMDGGSFIASVASGDGDAGNIVLNGGMLHLMNTAQIVSQAAGAGRGGNITVNASEVVLESGGLIETDAISTGHGGDIILNLGAGSLSLNNGQIVTTAADQGPAGNITINAGAVSFVGPDIATGSSILTSTTGPGSAGDISLHIGTLTLQGAASINNESFSETPAGSIRIVASELVTLSGSSASIASNNFGVATGTSGSVEITAPALTLTSSATINTINTSPARAGDIILRVGNTSLTGGASVHTNTGGDGRGGDILVTSDSVSISGTGSGLFSDSNFGTTGRAGDIQIQARQVDLSSGATISAQSAGTGNAGNITVMASDSLVMQNSSISTATTQSDGGNVTLQVGRLVELTDSQITTSVQGGLGNGGNITIDPQVVSLQNSQIIANAFGGNGGNISIVAGVFLVDPTSTISASSTFGLSGTVEIQATVSNLSESVAPLSGEFGQAAALLPARCAARFNQSSLVLAGRDGVPLEPGGLLPSPLYGASQGIAGPSVSLDVPGLRVGRAWGDSHVTLVALETGCAS